MEQIIDCPLCNGGKLNIEVPNGHKVIMSGAMRDLPCKVFCKTCNRFVKYAIKEKDKESK